MLRAKVAGALSVSHSGKVVQVGAISKHEVEAIVFPRRTYRGLMESLIENRNNDLADLAGFIVAAVTRVVFVLAIKEARGQSSNSEAGYSRLRFAVSFGFQTIWRCSRH
jgi:hypothetical protein